MASDRTHTDVSETLDALTHHHCRETIRYLMESDDGVATYDGLLDHLADIDAEHDRKHLLNLLYHQHLPKLADAEIIDHDHRSETIRYLEDEVAETILEELGQEL